MDSSDLSDGPITLQEYLEVKKALAASEAKVQQLMKVNNSLSDELRRLQREVCAGPPPPLLGTPFSLVPYSLPTPAYCSLSRRRSTSCNQRTRRSGSRRCPRTPPQPPASALSTGTPPARPPCTAGTARPSPCTSRAQC